jgi:hypothetical protein
LRERGAFSLTTSFTGLFMTPSTLRLVGRVFVGIALLILMAIVAGRFGLTPKVPSSNAFLVTAILFSVVGRGLKRRAARMQTSP